VEEADTFPKLLTLNSQRWSNRVAQRHKRLGIWKEYTWEDFYSKVRSLALGLLSLGTQPGTKAAIIGDNTPEWFWAELAIQCTQGVSVGIYPDMSASEVKYLLELSDSEIVFVKDQEQVDKLLESKDELPLLKKVIYWEPKGLVSYRQPILIGFEELIELGTEYENQNPGMFELTVEQGKGDDLAVLMPTSGTTAQCKLVMHSYKNVIAANNEFLVVRRQAVDDECLSVVPPGWAAEQLAFVTSLMTGRATNFAEAPETIQENLRELGPTLSGMLTGQIESMPSLVQARINDATLLKKLTYRLLLPIGYKRADSILLNKKPNLFWRALLVLADIVLFNPLKDRLGLSHVRQFSNVGGMLSVDAARWFGALGIEPFQVYGTSEVLWATAHLPGKVKLETVGPPLPDTEIKITEEGEIAIWKENHFLGYYKDSERTNQVLVDGWYFSGDAGLIDEDGHIVILDRLKDVMVLADGAKFSPQYIEGRLKFSPYVKDAVVFGGGDRPYLTALIIIDFENVSRWAERNNIPFTTFTDISQKPEVYELIRPDIERVNSNLPKVAKISKFANFFKELDPDEAELTRTGKLRRVFFEEHYRGLTEALFGYQETIPLEAEIKFADGRVRNITTELRVVSLTEE
jgi:long-chain acyl-CoA synthetase